MDNRYQNMSSIMKIRNNQLSYVHRNRKANEILLATRFTRDGRWVCQKCDYNSECKREFSFHHLDPHKKTATFASLLMRGNFTLDLIDQEGAVFWCENCHRLARPDSKRPCIIKITQENINMLIEHGLIDGCAQCKRKFPFKVYEFHHVLPKEYNVSRLIQRRTTSAILLIEAGKCVLLCSCCHRRVDCGLGPVFTTNCLNQNIATEILV